MVTNSRQNSGIGPLHLRTSESLYDYGMNVFAYAEYPKPVEALDPKYSLHS